MAEPYRTSFVVPAQHPALPGHFPGAPVVPGVVVLDYVLEAAELWQQRPLTVVGLKQVKFHSPLLPDQDAEVVIELTADALKFHVTRDEQLVARGTFVVRTAEQ